MKMKLVLENGKTIEPLCVETPYNKRYTFGNIAEVVTEVKTRTVQGKQEQYIIKLFYKRRNPKIKQTLLIGDREIEPGETRLPIGVLDLEEHSVVMEGPLKSIMHVDTQGTIIPYHSRESIREIGKKKIVAILRTFDELELTKKALKGLLDNTPQLSMLIVVDGYCAEDTKQETREWLKQWASPIPTEKIFMDKAYWSTYTFRRGLERVPEGFDYVLFVDNDVSYEKKDWLLPMLSLMQAREDVAEVVPIYWSVRRNRNDLGVLVPSWEYASAKGWKYLEDKEVEELVKKGVSYPVFSPTSSCALFRKKALDECNIFDERVIEYIEIAMSLPLFSAGWKVYVQPRSRVTHLESYTVEKHGYMFRSFDQSMQTRLIKENYPEIGIVMGFQRLSYIQDKFPSDRLASFNRDIMKEIQRLTEEVKNWEIKDLPNGQQLYRAIPEASYQIGLKEIFDPESPHNYEKFFKLEKGMTVISGGAASGMWTVKASKTIGVDGLILALEPNEKSYEVLIHNVELNNCTNVIPVKKALWSKTGKAYFNRGSAWDVGYVEDVKSEGSTEIETITMDDLMNQYGLIKADFVKIDVEGGEIEILKGWTKIRACKYLVMETHKTLNVVLDILKKEGIEDVQIVPRETTELLHVKIKKEPIVEFMSFYGNTGFGIAATNYLLGLDEMNVNIRAYLEAYKYTGKTTSISPIVEDETKKKILEIYKKRETRDSNVVIQMTCPIQPLTQGNMTHPSKYNIIWFVYESTRLKPEYVKILNTADEVWIPNEFCKRNFIDSDVKVPIYIIPLGVDPEIFKLDADPLFPKDRFTFLFIGDYTPRKGLDLFVKAFIEEFKIDEPVKALIHTSTTFGSSTGDYFKINHPNIMVTQREKVELQKMYDPVMGERKDLKRSEMSRLYASADCFVLPSRGEGFALCGLEALTSGVPVIYVNWGGQLCYLSPSVGYPVGYKLTPSSNLYSGPDANYAEPDLNDLKKQMRYVYEHPAEAKMKGKEGRRIALEEWTWKHACQKIAVRLDDIALKM